MGGSAGAGHSCTACNLGAAGVMLRSSMGRQILEAVIVDVTDCVCTGCGGSANSPGGGHDQLRLSVIAALLLACCCIGWFRRLTLQTACGMRNLHPRTAKVPAL
jgi:hypothetical protein